MSDLGNKILRGYVGIRVSPFPMKEPYEEKI